MATKTGVWVQAKSNGLVITEIKKKLKKPPLYKVLLHNDDYTTKEFVGLKILWQAS